MPDIKYELLEEYGVFSENNKGWTREVNLMSWNDGTPKYDIRDWAPDHDKMADLVLSVTPSAESDLREHLVALGKRYRAVLHDY
ncbi:MAG: hypothetical protein II742_05390, partial [Clostridia bacterium]|nr:hypothetical protein [Clostridia bacterium]